MPSGEQGLGPLEMRVLGLLEGEAVSVQAVQQALERAGHAVAYTTVMTVLVRLHDKGLVVRTKEGRRYLYARGRRAPAVTQRLVARIQRALFPGARAEPILALLDDDDLTRDDLRALRRKIDGLLKDKP